VGSFRFLCGALHQGCLRGSLVKKSWNLWRVFGLTQCGVLRPHFTTHLTTASPQKHHNLPTLFPKTPRKNTNPPEEINSGKNCQLR
jgi:hypothetical protein